MKINKDYDTIIKYNDFPESHYSFLLDYGNNEIIECSIYENDNVIILLGDNNYPDYEKNKPLRIAALKKEFLSEIFGFDANHFISEKIFKYLGAFKKVEEFIEQNDIFVGYGGFNEDGTFDPVYNTSDITGESKRDREKNIKEFIKSVLGKKIKIVGINEKAATFTKENGTVEYTDEKSDKFTYKDADSSIMNLNTSIKV